MNELTIGRKLLHKEMPGFILGLNRVPFAETKYVSHIYQGTFSEPGDPMCPRGWNRGDGYSIWRNNVGTHICKTCLKNTAKLFPSTTKK